MAAEALVVAGSRRGGEILLGADVLLGLVEPARREQRLEIAHDLADILLPHYLRPVPSCSVVEFQPIPGALRARVKLPRETEVASVPVEGTRCLFRTSAEMDLLPVTVLDAQLDQAIPPESFLDVARLYAELGKRERSGAEARYEVAR